MSEPVQLAKNTLPVAGIGELVVPLLAAGESERAATRYVEFFAAHIRNPNTRAAYARTATGFFAWCEGLGLALPAVQPVHVAAWVEQLGRDRRLAPVPSRCLPHDLAPRGSGRRRHQARLLLLAGEGDHRLFRERRTPRTRAADGGAFVSPDDEALRSTG